MKTYFGFLTAMLTVAIAHSTFGQPPEGRPGREPGGREQGGERGERMRGGFGGPGGGGPGGGRGGPGPEMMAGMLRMLPVMTALDIDEDGTLSPSEIENASKALLKLDRDGDGKLSAEELRPDPSKMPQMMGGFGGPGGGGPGGFGGPGGPGGFGGPGGPGMQGGQMSAQVIARLFETRDADKDGLLKGDEVPERMRERLRMMDENGDGALSKAEVEKASERLNQAGGRRPERADDAGGGVQPRRPPADR